MNEEDTGTMTIKNLGATLNHLVEYWKNQNIALLAATNDDIELFQQSKNLLLPTDFRELYSIANGMEGLYPNYCDKEGFLFYPLQAIESATKIFAAPTLANKDTWIFADYLSECWWYGFQVTGPTDYVIGIIPHEDAFQPITSSLAEFIELYLEDSGKLYDYE